MKGIHVDSSLHWPIASTITFLLPLTIPSECFQIGREGRGILRWMRRSACGQPRSSRPPPSSITKSPRGVPELEAFREEPLTMIRAPLLGATITRSHTAVLPRVHGGRFSRRPKPALDGGELFRQEVYDRIHGFGLRGQVRLQDCFGDLHCYDDRLIIG